MTGQTALLRWAGSKRQLLPTLRQFWPGGNTRYVEPFAGSACLFFDLAPKNALIGDLNADLIDTYRTIRRTPAEVALQLDSMPPASSEFYYSIRNEDPSQLPPEQRAARFIYLNRFCFNGLFRTNRRGIFNVPFSGSRNGALPTMSTIVAIAGRLRRTRLVCQDFGATLDEVAEDDFVYLDPPYWVTNQRVFREYSAAPFGAADLARLRQRLLDLSDRHIPFVVSYAESSQARELASGFRIREVTVRRNIAGFSSSRRRAQELLITPQYL